MSFALPDQHSLDREFCRALDARDPLASLRAEFDLPPGVVYLDGMSLGALPRAAAERVRAVVECEWGRGLVRSWNTAEWISAPEDLGSRLAPMIGVDGDEVIVADSTSVCLFKLICAALRLRSERTVILTDESNFPSDAYVAQGVQRLLPGLEIRRVPADAVGQAIDRQVAAVLLTHVDYKTGAQLDMSEITAQAHAAGAVVIWDLSHSTGAFPVELNECGVDLALGCGYKYLNGGPGAPAYLFVARRHHDALDQPISGWMGHVAPFAFDAEFVPAQGMRRMLSGTPPIVALAPLAASLDIWHDVDLQLVREKSVAQSELFLRLVENQCADPELCLASPRNSELRGSHLAYRHPQSYAVMQALIADGVIGDFRDPDVMRFGFTPLYSRFVDVWDAATAVCRVLNVGGWSDPRFQRRAAVT